MTNYDYLITLPVEKFNTAIISIVNQFGGNSELLLRYLNETYVNPHPTIREMLDSNLSGVNISFRYGGFVYSAVSVTDFLKKYGNLSSGLLDLKISFIRTSRNGDKTLIL